MAVRLDDIDYFLAVAAHGQARRAAAALGLSQPAITKGLQRLEKELGFPLFERSARGMALTPVAEQFRQRTQALRGSLQDAIKEAADLHLGAMGLLRVGVSPLYAQRLFVPACLQLHRQRPAARLRVMINLNDALLAALRLGDLDVTISALPGVMPDDLEAVPLLSEDLLLVVREGHPCSPDGGCGCRTWHRRNGCCPGRTWRRDAASRDGSPRPGCLRRASRSKSAPLRHS
jgi:DNA-binding transcriptional LysR family regulator